MTGALPDATTRCTRCGHGHSSAAWAALPVVHTLGEGDLRAYVVAWPTDKTVEVRTCSRCNGNIARLVVTAGARAAARA